MTPRWRVPTTCVQFANERQIQEWLTEKRAAGFKVKIQKREDGRDILPDLTKWS